MATFMEDLWNSIFTPGPTPTLLVATNVTFGALLLLLLCLLVATRSIHFLILSILSVSLWAAINWFAREVNIAHANEESLLKQDANMSGIKADTTSDQSVDEMDSGDDTEVELEEEQRQRESTPQVTGPRKQATAGSVESRLDSKLPQSNSIGGSNTTALQPSNLNRDARRRQQQSMAESTSSLSTDSEWEKVDSER